MAQYKTKYRLKILVKFMFIDTIIKFKKSKCAPNM